MLMNLPPKPEPRRLPIVPIHVPLLLAAVGAGVWMSHAAGVDVLAARTDGAWTAATRRALVTALSFNVVLGVGLLVFLASDALATVWALLKGGRVLRMVARMVLCLIPSVSLGTAHLVLNPWMQDLGRQAFRLLT